MFEKPKPFKGPPGSTTTYEVRYSKGRKPFPSRAEADEFARAERTTGGWASIDQLIRIEVEKRK